MITRYPDDPQDAIEVMHNLVGGLTWRFNHAGAGYLDRLDAAIGLGAKLADDSLPALQLAGDAAALRALADSLDERREALTGRAPRLMLVAAE